MQKKILVIEDDPVIMKIVSTVLKKNDYLVATAENGQEGVNMAATFVPDLILTDVMMPVMDGFEVCRRIRQDKVLGNVPIIMLTALTDVEQKIKGFEAGADDYLSKPFEMPELLMRMDALLRRSKMVRTAANVENVNGKVIGVYSLRGGAGVSTIATNLAAALPQLWNKDTVLVDLNLIAGQTALFLNMPLKHTWADIADVPLGEIDIELIESIMMEKESHLSVLAAPGMPEVSERITGDKVNHILNLLRSRYDYVILDLPHDFSDSTLTGLEASDEILLVMTPELAGVRAAMIALHTFKQLDFQPEGIRLIANWTFSEHGISIEKVENALHHKVELIIPHAEKEMMTALNFGTPVVLGAPESPLGSLFEDLAFALSRYEHNQKIPSSPTGAWARVSDRIKKRRKKLGKLK